MRRAGIGLASRVVDTPLGLATASWFQLVSEQHSGVRSPTQAKLLVCSRRTKIPRHKDGVFLVRRAGIEPATTSLKGSCSTTELPAQILTIASAGYQIFGVLKSRRPRNTGNQGSCVAEAALFLHSESFLGRGLVE